MVNSSILKEKMFKRIIDVQVSGSAVRNQKPKNSESNIHTLRDAYMSYEVAIKALLLSAADDKTYREELDKITEDVWGKTEYAFGTVRKCLNLIMFMITTSNEFVTDPVERLRIYKRLELPIDGQVYKFLRQNYQGEEKLLSTVTIPSVNKDRNQYLQGIADKIVEDNNKDLQCRYDIDFLAWRSEDDTKVD